MIASPSCRYVTAGFRGVIWQSATKNNLIQLHDYFVKILSERSSVHVLYEFSFTFRVLCPTIHYHCGCDVIGTGVYADGFDNKP